MPERADEATMLSDDIRDDTRTALLAKAAALWADDGPGGEGGCSGRRGGPWDCSVRPMTGSPS